MESVPPAARRGMPRKYKLCRDSQDAVPCLLSTSCLACKCAGYPVCFLFGDHLLYPLLDCIGAILRADALPRCRKCPRHLRHSALRPDRERRLRRRLDALRGLQASGFQHA